MAAPVGGQNRDEVISMMWAWVLFGSLVVGACTLIALVGALFS